MTAKAPTTAEVRERLACLKGYVQERFCGERASLTAYALPLAEERDAERARADVLAAKVQASLEAKPVRWLIIGPDGQEFCSKGASGPDLSPEDIKNGWTLAPLYRVPTISDPERVSTAIAACESALAASESAGHFQMQAVEARNGLRYALAALRGQR